jgi:MFS transporter, DHA1 family, multidrug resistance protein
MNEEDRRMQGLEREASPERFPSNSANRAEEVEEPGSAVEKAEKPEELARQETISSHSSSTSIDPAERPSLVSRMTTQHESGDLARHPTALSRIQTAKSQQSHTIGSGIRSRTATRHSRTPMPNFGGGKPFPPELPAQEDYVVEFDGPDGTCSKLDTML